MAINVCVFCRERIATITLLERTLTQLTIVCAREREKREERAKSEI
jgi:hypothetical protein